MKKSLWLGLGMVACLAVAAGAYLWANGLIGSLYDFRSPLHADPPQPGQPVGKPLTRRVVIVLIDALRDDTSHNPQVMPFLNQLRQQAAWATMHSRPPSYSEPGYTTLLTGAWPDINDGPAMNLEFPDIPTWTQDNLFSAAHRAGLQTAVSGYYWFEKLIPQSVVTDSFYTEGEDAAADVDVMHAALPMLDKPDQLVLIHIDQVDYAGHYLGGPLKPAWDQAASQADNYVKEIVTKLDLQQDTLVVLSDHGQIDRGGHGGQDPITLLEPFVLAGAGVIPGNYSGIQMVDVAPTVAVLLGLNLPASSQGYVLTDMLSLPAGEQPDVQTALKSQQSSLLAAYFQAIHSTSRLPDDPNIVTAAQTAIRQAQAARIERERIPRTILAIILALLPAVVLVMRRVRKALLLAGGAVFYAILFNGIYALIAGRTYSLSSVADQTDIILSTAGYTAASLVIAWLAFNLVSKPFRQGALRAAGSTLSLTWTILYLLFLPVLVSFALNGVLVTWTLPDFLSMFLAFLSILQVLVVAVVGLLLSGVSAGIASLAARHPKTT